MTSTGVFIRRSVRAIASRHCAAFIRSTIPVRSDATNTPVPAAESQLMVNRAASGFAFGGATGGIRWTRLWSAGMSHAGKDSVPPSFEPRSDASSFTPEKMPFRNFLNSGAPQSAQQAMRMAHGSHAYTVAPTLYGYFQEDWSRTWVVWPAATRSDLSRNRVLGCQMKRRKTAVQMTENTPETTSVMRWVGGQPEACHCMTAKEAPETSAAGQTSHTSRQLPPSIFTKVATSQNGTRIETKGSWCPAIAESVTWSSPETAASVTMGVPIAPQATGAVFASRFRTADWNGENPT